MTDKVTEQDLVKLLNEQGFNEPDDTKHTERFWLNTMCGIQAHAWDYGDNWGCTISFCFNESNDMSDSEYCHDIKTVNSVFVEFDLVKDGVIQLEMLKNQCKIIRDAYALLHEPVRINRRAQPNTKLTQRSTK